jgi:hypothetical protein
MKLCKNKTLKHGKDQCIHNIKANDGTCLCSLGAEFLCLENKNIEVHRLSMSAIASWNCKMKYYYKYIRKLSIRDEYKSPALKAGIIWDNYCEDVVKGTVDYNKLTIACEKYNIPKAIHGKLSALVRACIELGVDSAMTINNKEVVTQSKCSGEIDGYEIVGVLDRKYDEYFVETKLSSRPSYYSEKQNIYNQVGIYFMLNPELEKVIMEVTKMPAQKITQDESVEEFEDRVCADIIKRPSFYFIGIDRASGSFGTTFYRQEFNYDWLRQMIHKVGLDIRHTIDNDLWYPNHAMCMNPFMCDFFDIHKTGGISDLIFKERDIKK